MRALQCWDYLPSILLVGAVFSDIQSQKFKPFKNDAFNRMRKSEFCEASPSTVAWWGWFWRSAVAEIHRTVIKNTTLTEQMRVLPCRAAKSPSTAALWGPRQWGCEHTHGTGRQSQRVRSVEARERSEQKHNLGMQS